MRKALGLGLLGAGALLAAATAAAAPAGRDDRLWAAAQAAREAQVALLRDVVNVDSGTGDVAGGAKVQDIVAVRLQAIGMQVTRVKAEAPDLPDNLVATIEGH